MKDSYGYNKNYMAKLLLIEKYYGIEFPAYKTEKIQFIQGNKAVLIKKDRTYVGMKYYKWYQVGYVVMPLKEVSIDYHRDSSKDFKNFKKDFYILFSAKNIIEKKQNLEFGLHSSTVKKDWFIIGFDFRGINYIGEFFDEEKAVPIEIFLSALKKVEKKLKTYGNET